MHTAQRQLFDDTELEKLQDLRTNLSRAVHAETTLTSYRYDWSMFRAFCARFGRSALPATADTLGLYVTYILDTGLTTRTARRRVASVIHHHQQARYPTPYSDEVKQLLRGAVRQRLEKPRQKEPLQIEQIRAIAGILQERRTVVATRDVAILVIGFASALRRSNLVALGLEDTEFTHEGIVLTVHKEKQDQEGIGRLVALPKGSDPRTCPVACVEAWLAVRPGTAAGRLFTRIDRGGKGKPMDAEAIAKIVKRSVALLGLDPKRYGAHSLRAGFITEAAECGVSDTLIASHTGHRNTQSLRFYYRRRRLWAGNAAGLIGL